MAFQICETRTYADRECPNEGRLMSRTNLGLVLGLHVRGSQDLGVDALREAGVDVLPRRPDGETDRETPRNGEDRVPDDIPKEGVEEEEREVHVEHERERERGVVEDGGGV